MNSYRVEWTEIKPGGTEVKQCDLVRGTRSDVVEFLSSWRAGNIKPGTVAVTECAQSDGVATPIGDLGF